LCFVQLRRNHTRRKENDAADLKEKIKQNPGKKVEEEEESFRFISMGENI